MDPRNGRVTYARPSATNPAAFRKPMMDPRTGGVTHVHSRPANRTVIHTHSRPTQVIHTGHTYGHTYGHTGPIIHTYPRPTPVIYHHTGHRGGVVYTDQSSGSAIVSLVIVFLILAVLCFICSRDSDTYYVDSGYYEEPGVTVIHHQEPSVTVYVFSSSKLERTFL